MLPVLNGMTLLKIEMLPSKIYNGHTMSNFLVQKVERTNRINLYYYIQDDDIIALFETIPKHYSYEFKSYTQVRNKTTNGDLSK